jgi:flavin reductase (DIM6/NTAB) family NADH-FMN oxidoreductase RutF
MNKTSFDPDDLDGTGRYKLLIGLVVPRPIGWVGTLSPEGDRNLAPYSFFNVVSGTPPTVLFSPGRRAGVPKDSLRNVLETGQFTINLVDEELAAAMNVTSGEYGPDTDEFDVADLASRPGNVVAAPLVEASPANLECVVTRSVDVGVPPSNTVVFGNIVRVHVRADLLDGTRVDPIGLRAVGRMAGSGYTRTVDGYFEMERPRT